MTAEEVQRVTAGPGAPGWSDFDRVLLRAADELHASRFVSHPTWAALAERYTEEQLVEVVLIVGNYTQLAMFQNSAGRPAPARLQTGCRRKAATEGSFRLGRGPETREEAAGPRHVAAVVVAEALDELRLLGGGPDHMRARAAAPVTAMNQLAVVRALATSARAVVT